MRVKSPVSAVRCCICFSVLATIIVMVLPTLLAAMKPSEKKDEQPGPPAWRVIDDAPYRAIPGLPVLAHEGEPLAKLGDNWFIDNRSHYYSIAFSPDGRFIASGSEDSTVRLWDAQAKALVHSFQGHAGSVSSVAFSPGGRFIASGSHDNTVRLWDAQAKALVHSFQGHAGSVVSVAFSPGGRFIASGSHDNTVRLWDAQAKALIHTFEEHAGSVSSVAFSPDGRFIASGAGDRILRLWNIQTKALVNSFQGHAGSVSSVAFSPDSRFIASGSHDNTVRLWDAQANALIHTFRGHANPVYSVIFSPDGGFIASGSHDNTVNLWDVQAKTLAQTFQGHIYSIFSVAFSPDGRFFASGSRDNTVRLWDIQTKTLVQTFQGHDYSVNSVAFSPDGRFIASGSDDDTIRLWDIQANALVHSFQGHANPVNSVAFSPDGRFIASGSDDRTLRLWDIQTKALAHTFRGHAGLIASVAFSPDGRFTVSGSYDSTVRLWDIQTKTLVNSFQGHANAVNSVAFSVDGRLIASGSDDDTIRLWDIQKKTLVNSFEGHAGSVASVAFSPDGRFIASGAYDNTVRLWDIQKKTLVNSFEGHAGPVTSVAFSPNSRLIASGAYDSTIRFWDTVTRAARQEAYGGRRGNWLIRSADSTVRRGDDGTLLMNRAADGSTHPIMTADMAAGDMFSISVPLEPITVLPGESHPLAVKIENTGSTPVFWLHLKTSFSADKALRLAAPDRFLTGKGRQPWLPDRIARLDPGQTATLHARITPNLPLPAALPKPGPCNLDLTVVSANGTEVTRTITVDLKSPQLAWERARLEDDDQTLRIDLHNTGNLALRNFSIYLQTYPQQIPNENTAASAASIPKLGPDQTTQLAFVLPEGIDWKQTRLRLAGQTAELPIFQWRLTAPEIERAGRLLYWLLVPLLAAVIVSLFFLRRYRHPLVVQLSEEPKALLRLPPEQLAEARNRLKQTGRLAKILSEAEVTPNRLDEAISFFLNPNAEEKARKLANRLGAGLQHKGPDTWGLDLPDTFPLRQNRCLLHIPQANTEPGEAFKEWHQRTGTLAPFSLLIGQDSDYQRRLMAKTADRTNKLIAPSGPDITQLLLNPDPLKVLAGIMADQLSLSLISPYQLGGGVNREPQFFGRQKIIAHIMNRDPANYLIVSGRQLGKSSLLKALDRRYADHPGITCLYRSLGNEVLVPRLAKDLGLSKETDIEGIADYISNAKHRFLILIDEADKFIRLERENDYRILDAMRSMSEEGHCHFILAGFWELYQHAVLDYQSPLKNFAEIIQIGELEADACRRLATAPMNNLRLSYADPALVDRLLSATGQRANLMVIACQNIISELRPGQRIIQSADIDRALSSTNLLEALKGWDEMTDDAQACNMDRIVVYTTIEQGRFTYKQLIDLLRHQGLKARVHQVDHSLNRLLLGFVLGKEDGAYSYRVPLFREMIIRDDYQTRLEEEVRVCRLDD